MSNAELLPISAQILSQLQTIAAQQELRFEVNRSTALVFQVGSRPNAGLSS